jgi:hypothetical protein
MIRQLIYSSAAEGVIAGRSGYQITSVSPGWKASELKNIERFCTYPFPESLAPGEAPLFAAWWTVQMGELDGCLLLRSFAAGPDYTGRSHFTAHLLFIPGSECANCPLPPAILGRWQAWAQPQTDTTKPLTTLTSADLKKQLAPTPPLSLLPSPFNDENWLTATASSTSPGLILEHAPDQLPHLLYGLERLAGKMSRPERIWQQSFVSHSNRDIPSPRIYEGITLHPQAGPSAKPPGYRALNLASGAPPPTNPTARVFQMERPAGSKPRVEVVRRPNQLTPSGPKITGPSESLAPNPLRRAIPLIAVGIILLAGLTGLILQMLPEETPSPTTPPEASRPSEEFAPPLRLRDPAPTPEPTPIPSARPSPEPLVPPTLEQTEPTPTPHLDAWNLEPVILFPQGPQRLQWSGFPALPFRAEEPATFAPPPSRLQSFIPPSPTEVQGFTEGNQFMIYGPGFREAGFFSSVKDDPPALLWQRSSNGPFLEKGSLLIRNGTGNLYLITLPPLPSPPSPSSFRSLSLGDVTPPAGRPMAEFFSPLTDGVFLPDGFSWLILRLLADDATPLSYELTDPWSSLNLNEYFRQQIRTTSQLFEEAQTEFSRLESDAQTWANASQLPLFDLGGAIIQALGEDIPNQPHLESFASFAPTAETDSAESYWQAVVTYLVRQSTRLEARQIQSGMNQLRRPPATSATGVGQSLSDLRNLLRHWESERRFSPPINAAWQLATEAFTTSIQDSATQASWAEINRLRETYSDRSPAGWEAARDRRQSRLAQLESRLADLNSLIESSVRHDIDLTTGRLLLGLRHGPPGGDFYPLWQLDPHPQP